MNMRWTFWYSPGTNQRWCDGTKLVPITNIDISLNKSLNKIIELFN